MVAGCSKGRSRNCKSTWSKFRCSRPMHHQIAMWCWSEAETGVSYTLLQDGVHGGCPVYAIVTVVYITYEVVLQIPTRSLWTPEFWSFSASVVTQSSVRQAVRGRSDKDPMMNYVERPGRHWKRCQWRPTWRKHNNDMIILWPKKHCSPTFRNTCRFNAGKLH